MLASSTSSSPTITGHQSPRNTYRSPRPPTNLNRRISQARSSTTSYNTETTNAPPQQPPKTADVGTQYSPPDWPPTDPRSSLYPKEATTAAVAPTSSEGHPLGGVVVTGGDGASDTKPPQARVETRQQQQDSTSQHSNQELSQPPPPEPHLRITPQTELKSHSRRRSDDGSTVADSKRPRHTRDRKMLSSDYTECDSKLLGSLIASMLMRLIQYNDTIPLKDGQLTRFHSRAPPGISVADYMSRLTFHATLSPPILLSMVFLMDRLSDSFPQFIINSLTVHRFLITAATVASKGLSDSFWTNSTYAKVGGVSVKELALLELELLIKCGWKIVPSPDRLVDYYRGLVQGSDDYMLGGSDSASSSSDGDDEMDTSGDPDNERHD